MRAWLSALVLAMACSADEVTNPGGGIGNPAFRYGPPDGGGGGETTLGNNLSNPVIFAEAYGITGLPISQADLSTTGLRVPTDATYPTLPDFFKDPNAATVVLQNGSTGYCQQTLHSWMAQWSTGATTALADWGDNLSSQVFTSTSQIRVEMTLLAPGTMTGYNMYLYSGTRRTELQCTDLTENTGLQPTVYSVSPRLRIYKVSADQATPGTDPPLVDLAVADGFGQDGPGFYAAEINVGGKAVYGYNLNVKQLPVTDKKGWYLISFSLDPAVSIGGVNVFNGVTLTGVVPQVRAKLASPAEAQIWVQVTDSKGKKGGQAP